jgi:YbgC/YbaW family acyl-CoA thioester hydrolase
MEDPRAPRVVVRIRVPFVDVDNSNRIHFTAMFRYMEVAEHELMRALGLPYASALFEVAFPRVHLECDFHAGIIYDDLLDVEARIEHVGTRSWTVAFAARHVALNLPAGDEVSGRPAAVGRMVIVAMDPATQRATSLPEALRRALCGEQVNKHITEGTES